MTLFVTCCSYGKDTEFMEYYVFRRDSSVLCVTEYVFLIDNVLRNIVFFTENGEFGYIKHVYQMGISVMYIRHVYQACISGMYISHVYQTCISGMYIRHVYQTCISDMYISMKNLGCGTYDDVSGWEDMRVLSPDLNREFSSTTSEFPLEN